MSLFFKKKDNVKDIIEDESSETASFITSLIPEKIIKKLASKAPFFINILLKNLFEFIKKSAEEQNIDPKNFGLILMHGADGKELFLLAEFDGLSIKTIHKYMNIDDINNLSKNAINTYLIKN